MAAWACVRCGAFGVAPAQDLTAAAPRARSRWRRFRVLIACPRCGDARGHAGVLELLPGEELGRGPPPAAGAPWDGRDRRDRRLPPSRAAADRAARIVAAALRKLGAEATIRELVRRRSFPPDLAALMVRRGVRWVEPGDLRFLADLGVPWRARGSGFLLPVAWFLPTGEGPGLMGFQIRTAGAETRYLTVRIFQGGAPPAALLLPGGEPSFPARFGPGPAPWPFRDGAWPEAPEVLAAEGWFKAAVAADLLGIPALGFLGIPRRVETVVRRLRDLGARVVILAPDRDIPPRPEVEAAWAAFAEMARRAGLRVRVLAWRPEDGKGIDDVLLAGRRPEILAPAIPARAA